MVSDQKRHSTPILNFGTEMSLSKTGSQNAAHHGRPKSFLLLPPELRILVYNHLFSPRPRPPFYQVEPPLLLLTAVAQRRIDLEPALAQLPELCDEVLAEYYKHVECGVYLASPRRNLSLEACLDLIGDANAQCIRHLSIVLWGSVKVHIQMSNQIWKHRFGKMANVRSWTASGRRHVLRVESLCPMCYSRCRVCCVAPCCGRSLTDRLSDRLERMLARDDRCFLTKDDIIMFVADIDPHARGK